MSPRRRDPSSVSIGLALALAFFATVTASAQTSAPPAYHFGGFADATVSRPIGGHRNDFDLGELDLYATAQLSDTWSALGEGLVQRVGRGSDADVGSSRVEGEIERLYIAYSRSDVLRMEIGRVNTGIIDWNERENRSRFLQTPIDVPSIARRQEQGGAWPLHFLGGWASGSVPGTAGVHYGVGIGEGRSKALDDVALLSGGSVSPAGLLSLSIAPDRLTGFQLGAAALVDTIPAAEGKYHEVDRTLSTSYVNRGIEFRSEWSRMDHRLQGSGTTYVTEGWYALLSVRLRGPLKVLRPYVLFDRLNVAKGEPYLATVNDQHSWAAGTRWDATKYLALKLDYRVQTRSTSDSRDVVRLQLAISF
ncbi:MAG TPA: hypothetical protein VHU41_00970 [Thermoanaerobaculia bacterium]|nr:hypothetical protein [Thermoanaerobaculia bacterium]